MSDKMFIFQAGIIFVLAPPPPPKINSTTLGQWGGGGPGHSWALKWHERKGIDSVESMPEVSKSLKFGLSTRIHPLGQQAYGQI